MRVCVRDSVAEVLLNISRTAKALHPCAAKRGTFAVYPLLDECHESLRGVRQTPPACDGDSTQRIGPVRVTATYHIGEFVISLQPCQTVSVQVSVTGDDRFGAAFTVEVFNQETAARSLFKTAWPSYGATERTLPIGNVWVPPYRGTRGAEGLPGRGTIIVQQLSGKVATYTITIIKKRRPSYNIGGDSFSTAPAIPQSSLRWLISVDK